MKIFKIPVTWEMYGVMEIEAETLEQAKELAITSAPLPEGSYIDDSCVVDEDGMSDNHDLFIKVNL